MVTIVILASRGTATNHMVELQMASTLVTAIAVARGELPSRVVTPAYLALAALMAAWSWPVPRLPTTLATLQARGPNRRATVSALRAEYGGEHARYLSLDPIVPVLSNERPLVADAFYLDLFVEGGAPAGRDLARRVERREFDAILVRDADTFPRDMMPDDLEFEALCRRFWAHDLALLRLFRSTYAVREVRRPFVVLTPEPAQVPSSR
jgi:hypothetical protein